MRTKKKARTTTMTAGERLAAAGLLLVISATLAGCSDDDGGAAQATAYAPAIEPADFTSTIDNPYLPLMPGTRWVYASTDGVERVDVEVTAQTRVVMGVVCVVVSDTASEDGSVVERTLDWYAQDADGAVWYFGEETAEYENGVPTSTEGSWEAGVDGAQPGVVMPAHPEPGEPYRQEYYLGEAEDMGQVLATGQTITVPAGTYSDVVQTRDWTPLEPDVEEHKFYAPGVGVVAEVTTKGGSGSLELVEVHRAGG
jgi:hypothetical protein